MSAVCKTVLDNGIRVISQKMDHCQSVSIGIWVKTGSRDESKDQNGISHFLEHMTFCGTEKRSAFEIAVGLESLGGHLNAFTEKEITCFYALILPEHLPQAVDVLSDILQNPSLSEADIKKERAVIFEEIKNLDDTPEEAVHDFFYSTLFGNSGLGMPILGSPATLKRLSRETLKSFQSRFYTADHTIVAAAGAVEHSSLVELAKQFFGELHRGSPIPERSFESGKYEKRVKELPIHQAHLCMGVLGFSTHDPKRYAAIVLNTLLGAGMSSRLFQILRERLGLVYSVYSFLDFWQDTGIFGIYAGTGKTNVNRTREAIIRELDRIGSEPISKTELEQVQSQLRGHLIISHEDCTNRMNRMARQEANQTCQTIDETIRKIQSVTIEDVLETAQELFGRRNLVHAALLPES